MSALHTDQSAAVPSSTSETPASAGPIEQRPEWDPKAAGLLTAERALRLRSAPLRFDGRRLIVAMVDPSDSQAADEISVVASKPVVGVAISEPAFADLMRAAYGTTAAQMGARLGGGDADDSLVTNLEAIEADDLHRMAEQPSLINLVNLVILEAIRARASDIHIEPFEKLLTVKYRIDGQLTEQQPPPKHLQPAITSRIKIMAGMNIAERYAPQDGHITLRYEGRKIDLRVSTVPTLYGESVVMRILDKESITLDLATLGMREPDRVEMDHLVGLPHGMVLVTGPTGSGKTTTLYACLMKVCDPSKKVLTIEDPVEYELSGVNQIPVNPKRGLSFASGLRSILRQDPDIIMVGEIRDAETAEISVRAAMTGHLIFSTLHTNNAASAVGRLLDMGIEPFLLASVLEGILAQRLGRRLCQFCRAPAPLPEEVRHRLSPAEQEMFPGAQAFKGRGCDKCDQSGFKRRLGFYELISVTPAMRAAVGQRVSAQEMMKHVQTGFTTMRRDGLIKASQGLTAVQEVLRATQDTDDAI
jgi:type II secretory ATPase GspE/PulE/Tfp pilus assembly ATPase PilB-like protein